MFMLVAIGIGLVIPLNTACVDRGFSLHCNIKNKLRNRWKIPQVNAMLRIKLLYGLYQDFDYPAAIDLFEDGTGAGTGLQAQLAKEVSDVEEEEEVAIDVQVPS